MADRGRRAFRPNLDGRDALESRFLLSAAHVSVASDTPFKFKSIHYQTAFGGKIAKIRDTDFELYNVDITGGGFVRAKPQKGGRVELIVNGSNSSSVLSINPDSHAFHKGTAHMYPPGASAGDHLLHVGNIKVTSGRIGQILAYQTADLSGKLEVAGSGSVDRIAFNSYQPGASIITGGDVNTLDAFVDFNIGGGPGVSIGRDLNWFNVGGNFNIGSGSTFLVGRDVGLEVQPAKGTDPGGQGAHIHGNMNVDQNGAFIIGRALEALFLIDGSVTGGDRIQIPFGGSNFFARGGITP